MGIATAQRLTVETIKTYRQPLSRNKIIVQHNKPYCTRSARWVYLFIFIIDGYRACINNYVPVQKRTCRVTYAPTSTVLDSDVNSWITFNAHSGRETQRLRRSLSRRRCLWASRNRSQSSIYFYNIFYVKKLEKYHRTRPRGSHACPLGCDRTARAVLVGGTFLDVQLRAFLNFQFQATMPDLLMVNIEAGGFSWVRWKVPYRYECTCMWRLFTVVNRNVSRHSTSPRRSRSRTITQWWVIKKRRRQCTLLNRTIGLHLCFENIDYSMPAVTEWRLTNFIRPADKEIKIKIGNKTHWTFTGGSQYYTCCQSFLIAHIITFERVTVYGTWLHVKRQFVKYRWPALT